ncbi:ABC transporter ATP-binding protein [Enterococcus hulanensis]|uniref:ABC transporter ATP-binding protein n=1 Tax=Enterococcus hulanensis TaxID=2559929 RepID=A0ABU3EYH9_9ENTE|nr:ABC transporter ATP-binding protein [Enterococcus hulanensis]MDT2599011.1 ABC transporter ATP-binding protein [Enterococcus hulanensis]MDT2610662.1 ABC transporter ATP-binding protein [Enterococcus hulanensis]MDT2614780.1 ABC transporter ATP-binding protein [Enterococcus hulanensis]MDT2627250.1 ABC transporter ATP-binding protein [Enterococcus hulanensis]MDT2653850.1 ABC transporter ATP-binding protein [Enterococcus hulanensis]
MTRTILEIRDLRKSYGRNNILNGIDLQLLPGKITGLLGRNGAGKTTLMKCVLGLTANYHGKVVFNGKNLSTTDTQTRMKIGSLVDVQFYEDLTAYDNLMLSIRLIDSLPKKERKRLIQESLEFVELSNAAKKKVKNFSFGMKQRLALALSLITKPELLILDEPFVGLDPIGVEEVKDLLRKLCRERGTAILFSSHQMQEVCDLTDNILVLSKGVISYSDQNRHFENQQAQLIELMK